ncbi:solute carrier family 25 member 35-like [Watersipora subatra]|uniref:solute carrier family 25 member 35-like n=1 Tax=Watersipora subatra TaxID=2589382 RepID=UPI00355B20D4
MSKNPLALEFFFGGISTCGAAIFTNPLEVVKTRLQLQGELRAKGQFRVHYRNVFHAFFAVAKHEGICSLQKGLGPALAYQFVMNGFRLGSFQLLNDSLLRDKDGHTPVYTSVLCGAISGSIGGFFGSPLYMIKTHMQSRSYASIAVGYQNRCDSLISALSSIYKQYGVIGLWRGSSGAVARVMMGSAAQLSTFSQARQYIINSQIFPQESLLIPFAASTLSGGIVVMVMTPFDVVSTRLYNQKVEGATSRGVLYSGITDCFTKIFRKEGLWGFYKGWAASLFRLGPHTVLSLVFWDRTRSFYCKWQTRATNSS